MGARLLISLIFLAVLLPSQVVAAGKQPATATETSSQSNRNSRPRAVSGVAELPSDQDQDTSKVEAVGPDGDDIAADLKVDGSVVGRTPWSGKLDAGKRVLEVVDIDGRFEPVTRTVEVDSQRPISQRLEFKTSVTGRMIVEKSGGSVYLGLQPLSDMPADGWVLPVGRYEVTVVKGDAVWSAPVTIAKGAVARPKPMMPNVTKEMKADSSMEAPEWFNNGCPKSKDPAASCGIGIGESYNPAIAATIALGHAAVEIAKMVELKISWTATNPSPSTKEFSEQQPPNSERQFTDLNLRFKANDFKRLGQLTFAMAGIIMAAKPVKVSALGTGILERFAHRPKALEASARMMALMLGMAQLSAATRGTKLFSTTTRYFKMGEAGTTGNSDAEENSESTTSSGTFKGPLCPGTETATGLAFIQKSFQETKSSKGKDHDEVIEKLVLKITDPSISADGYRLYFERIGTDDVVIDGLQLPGLDDPVAALQALTRLVEACDVKIGWQAAPELTSGTPVVHVDLQYVPHGKVP